MLLVPGSALSSKGVKNRSKGLIETLVQLLENFDQISSPFWASNSPICKMGTIDSVMQG